jgi:glycosyltransferase involved in cell wall biosynthesis
MAGKRIKITYLIGSLNVGGTQKHLFDLVRRLDRTRFEPAAMVFQPGGLYHGKFLEQGVPVYSLDIHSGLDLVKRFPRLIKYVWSSGTNIWHLVLFVSSFYGSLVRLLDPFGRQRILLSKRSMENHMAAKRKMAYRWVVMRCADVITAVSVPVHQRCLELGADPRKVRVLRNGIEWIEHKDPGRLHRTLGVPPETRLIGTAASLTIRKGLHHVIGMLPRLLKEFPDVRMALLGDGNLRSQLEGQCRDLGVADRVLMPGTLAPGTDYIGDFSVFLQPSAEEGTSNAVLEAMMLGVPCVVSDIPANREIIEHGIDGLIVPVEDEAAFAGAIAQILGDERLRTRLVNNAREKVRTLYPLDAMIKANEDLYERLARREL